MPAREPDPEVLELLRTTRSVNLSLAAELLQVSPRHLRRLIESGAVETIGHGQWRRITSKSMLERFGEEWRT